MSELPRKLDHGSIRWHCQEDRQSSRNRRPVAPEGRQRSKISNGNKLIAGVDGRSLWVRRLKDLIADGISDLGIDNTSATSCGAPNFLGNSLTGCAGLKAVSARFSAAYWFVVGHDTMPAMGSRYAQTYPSNSKSRSPPGLFDFLGLEQFRRDGEGGQGFEEGRP